MQVIGTAGPHCGIRMLLNSSGTAFMISTSFGALARQYLLDACKWAQQSGQQVLVSREARNGACNVDVEFLAHFSTSTRCLRERTSRLMAFRLTSLPSFTPRCSSATISVMARTRACIAAALFDTHHPAMARRYGDMKSSGAHLLRRQQWHSFAIDTLLALVGGSCALIKVGSHVPYATKDSALGTR